METLGYLLHGFETAFTWWNLLYCLIGVSAGMFLGVLPGLGPVSGTALLLPLTFNMEPVSAIIMLSGIYYGAMYGGTITSVLINVPGEAASVVTCIDGNQMAKQGRAGTALGVAAIGSFIGGITSLFALAFVGPPLAEFALKFGPPEYFALLMFGLLMVVAFMGKSLIKGLIAAVIGLILSLVGMDPVSGATRFIFGQAELVGGLDFIILAMGFFGVAEILSTMETQMKSNEIPKIQGLLPKKEEWKPTLKAVGRGTGLGIFLGLVPGANTVISSLLSYSLEKKVAKDPTRFGKGAIEGVAGPETANNAHSGSSLIPLFTLGVPSSPTVAVIFGAFIMHGLQPGPGLFQKNPDFVWGIIASMFIGNVILLIFNLPMARFWAKLTQVPFKLLLPLILFITLLGTYSVNNSLWDVFMTIVFGVLGYFMKKLEIPVAALILTFILGSQIETALLQSLRLAENGSASIFFERPISGAIMGISLLVLIIGVISEVKKKRSMLSSDVEI
ncbi:tripartite tricarboxylate transporter permease [Brevibacillus nitrificans]|uniref:Tripartite tricarboxylate transporter permease n=1 Tax=Brevibacillus nitrificans TaxID=651560 RepID=A0A3M8DCP8_9BACL|nr:tripartite tricarboxylate transporter permease [Brevibacillus nitrificans]RNB85371.1 tripartite tricarboxylate transporter permease [Brevibacillus nitrificans]